MCHSSFASALLWDCWIGAVWGGGQANLRKLLWHSNPPLSWGKGIRKWAPQISFVPRVKGFALADKYSWAAMGGWEPRIKRLKFPIRGWRAAASRRWDAKRASLRGDGGGRYRLEVAAAGLRRHRQSLSCWKSFAVLSRMPLCAFCSLSGMHHAYDQHFPPPFLGPAPPPLLHLIASQLQTLISRCPHPRRAFILYCRHAAAVSSRLSAFEDVCPRSTVRYPPHCLLQAACVCTVVFY